jgi:phage antirepressor YoqD-like protein
MSMVQSERNEKEKKRKMNAVAAPKVMFQQRNLEKRCLKKRWKRSSIMQS